MNPKLFVLLQKLLVFGFYFAKSEKFTIWSPFNFKLLPSLNFKREKLLSTLQYERRTYKQCQNSQVEVIVYITICEEMLSSLLFQV